MSEERFSEAKALLERRKKESIPWFANPLKFSETNSDGYALVERKHESTTIELFYDLFFVGNLTTFTYVHEINDFKSFRSYTGFFTIIWFTWLQTALFDCRFERDSVVERCWKFIQFGVMIGFAAVGSEFRPNEADSDFKSFKAVSVILLISQLLLAVQYLTILIAVIKRKHKSAITPLAMIVGIYFIAAMVFIGLTFTFKKNAKPNKAYIVWYIALIVESVLVTVVALWRRILSFKFSNIVERMGLLTLIILGEGVIGLAKTANKVIYKEGWTVSSLYEVIAYTATIFFMWMLYFDYNPRTHYGSIRQQLWALLHYPFHLACVLLPEGFGNMVIWRNIVNDVMAIGESVRKATQSTTAGQGFLDLGILANGTAKVLKIKPEDMATSPEWADLTTYIEKIKTAGSASGNVEDLQNATLDFLMKAVSLVFKGFKVALPESIQRKQGKDSPITETQLDQYTDIFRLVYAYFFGSAAAVVLLYAVFLFLARKRYDKYDIISMFYRVFVAIGLVCATTITFHNASLEKVMLSPWYIPIVPLALGLLIAADRLLHFIAIRAAKRSLGRVDMHVPSKSGKASPESLDTGYNPTTTISQAPMFSPQPREAEDVGRGYYPMTDMTSNVMVDTHPVDPRITHGPYSGNQMRNSRSDRDRRGYSDV